ncbi:MAG: group III truncated hemoglobin [Hoeflea sp.]|uniref:group III truncated hemoglobin n=1 Tax=Hoeflea sp. TaxID=1940281 RepID=UPI002731023C|nr:group III truncated hemoglobin [Hoeflea sp.]MDP2122194.1 group III truncated hemoglobin [Hoeflea sp.]MDP3524812.1 group III truncated hemoglobin [Hoeflea sp.]
MSERPAPIVIEARAAQPRTPAVDISPAEIALLVDRFYADIRLHPRLGPLFEAKLAGNWDMHLERMNRFWRSVLLHSGEYSGQPVVKHNALPGLEEEDFRLWIGQFEATAGALFAPDTAAAITIIARRIARSLWLARFGTPFNQAPEWLA